VRRSRGGLRWKVILVSFLYVYNKRAFPRDSSVVHCGATGWMIVGSRPGRGWEFFSSSPCPDLLWSPPSLLSNGYQELFPVNMTTHLYLVPRSRIRGAISPFPNTPLPYLEKSLYFWLTLVECLLSFVQKQTRQSSVDRINNSKSFFLYMNMIN
jgi:hypothetical protein